VISVADGTLVVWVVAATEWIVGIEVLARAAPDHRTSASISAVVHETQESCHTAIPENL